MSRLVTFLASLTMVCGTVMAGDVICVSPDAKIADSALMAVSGNPDISAQGGYVAFDSAADNLVPEDANTFEDVFVYSVAPGEITRVNLNSDGEPTPGMAPRLTAAVRP